MIALACVLLAAPPSTPPAAPASTEAAVDPIFLGVTPKAHLGRIEHPKAGTGLTAAAAWCAEAFGPEAHMCTPQDMYFAVLAGTLNAASHLDPAWVFAPGFSCPDAATEAPETGMHDTCGYFTMGENDKHWFGVAVLYGMLPSGVPGVYYQSRFKAPCQTPLPIACCR